MTFARRTLAAMAAAAFMASGMTQATACTALIITDANGVGYSGKTMEYPAPIPLQMTYMPAGTRIVSFAPDGSDAATFKTRYPVLGGAMPAAILPGAHQGAMIEAINDQGLSLSSNQLTGSRTPDDIGTDTSKLLAATDLANWLLGTFSNVTDAKAALESGAMKVWLPRIPFAGNVEMPEHYVLFDKTGKGIVIEFRNGAMNVYDNPVGVATNGPGFLWHLENLNNYAFLNNNDRDNGQFGTLKVKAEDNGNALSALPSTQISSGRFVKAAYYTTYVRKAKTPDDAVITLAHILNNFDRPYDLAVDPPGSGGDGPAVAEATTEVTVFTWMNDKGRNRYYLRNIDQMNFATFDLEKLKGVTKEVSVPFTAVNDSTLDGTALLLQAAGQ